MVPPYMPGPKPPSSFLMTSIVLGHVDFPERLRMDRLAVRVSERGRHVVVARQRDVRPPRLSDPPGIVPVGFPVPCLSIGFPFFLIGVADVGRATFSMRSFWMIVRFYRSIACLSVEAPDDV